MMIGRVCIPIDPLRCRDFNPMAVPTLTELCQELDATNSAPVSMKPHIELFKVFLKTLAESIRVSLRAQRLEDEKKLNF